MWALDKQGHLHSLNLLEIEKENWRKIPTIENLKDISSGDNHILMLKKDGTVYSMGDDTYGQCGLGAEGRQQGGPFFKTKVNNPTLLESIKNISIKSIHSKGDFNYLIS